MKTPLGPVSLAVTLLASLVLSAPAPGGAPAPLQEEVEEVKELTSLEKYEEFKKRFREALQLNSHDEIASLIARYTEAATWEIVDICRQIETGTSESLEREIQALITGWKQAKNTDFPYLLYEYYSLQTSQMKVARQRIQNRYDFIERRFFNERETLDAPAYETLGLEFAGMAESFTEVGDWYHSSQCWYYRALCSDEERLGDDADLDTAFQAYRRMREARDHIQLKDPAYTHSTERQKMIVDYGYGEDDPTLVAGPAGGDAEAGEAPAAAAKSKGPLLSAEMSFEAIEDLEQHQRPTYYADDYYVIWPYVFMARKGTSGRFLAMESSPPILRSGAAKIEIDTDNDGKGDVQIPVTGNVNLTEIEIEGEDGPRMWAFLSIVANDQELYQGLQLNLQPDDYQFQLFIAPAASVVGTLGETTLRIFDDNMDGVYGSWPRAWGYDGLVGEAQHWEFDSMLVQGDRTARPWSWQSKIGDQWYELEALGGGTKLQAKPVEPKTGFLSVEAKGIKPEWLIVSGLDKVQGNYFDLVPGGKKGVEVPVGKYELMAGLVRKGKRKQLMKALILPGPNTKAFSVRAGETTTVSIGAPYGFEFSYLHERGKLTVQGNTIVTSGAGGEIYSRPWNCKPNPEVSWRKAGAKRGSKPETMKQLIDIDQITQYGYKATWHPFDLVVDVRKAGDEGIEVQLVEKKNKLFGKIESDWK